MYQQVLRSTVADRVARVIMVSTDRFTAENKNGKIMRVPVSISTKRLAPLFGGIARAVVAESKIKQDDKWLQSLMN